MNIEETREPPQGQLPQKERALDSDGTQSHEPVSPIDPASDALEEPEIDAALQPFMDPGNSPSRPGVPVRRVNNLPVVILAVGVGVVLVAFLAAAYKRGAFGSSAANFDSTTSSARSMAEAIAGKREAGEAPPPPAAYSAVNADAVAAAAAAGQLPMLPVSGSEGSGSEDGLPADFPPHPPSPPTLPGAQGELRPPQSAASGPAPYGPGASGAGRAGGDTGSYDDQDALDARDLSRMRLDMFKSALRAPTTVRGIATDRAGLAGEGAEGLGPRSPAALGGQGGYMEKLQALQRAGLLPQSPAPGGAAAGAGAARGDAYSQFDAAAGEDRWKNDGRLEVPGSRYELRAGAVIPATMISGINSDLPGQITAIVAQDVRDTATGQYILIPQASRLVGTYGSDVKFGQERVLVAWQRIVFPDGKALDIGAMPGADGAGYAGMKDLVNNHYFRLFASAALMSGITAGITVSQGEAPAAGEPVSMSAAMTQSLGQQFGQLSEELIRRQMNVAPTIEIRPGYRFNVQVTKDLTFNAPYAGFDYDRSIAVTRHPSPRVARGPRGKR